MEDLCASGSEETGCSSHYRGQFVGNRPREAGHFGLILAGPTYVVLIWPRGADMGAARKSVSEAKRKRYCSLAAREIAAGHNSS